MSIEPASRRTALKVGVWTAPVVVVATVAPAVAASTGVGVITIGPGRSRASSGTFSSLVLNGLSITTSRPTARNTLTMAITLTPGRLPRPDIAPPAWMDPFVDGSSLVYVFAGTTSAGVPLLVTSPQVCDDDSQGGTFVLTVAAPDHDPGQISFPIPG